METLNKLRLAFYSVFIVVNPALLIVAFLVSFFSIKYSVSMIEFLHWFFLGTLLLAIPQMYHNYKTNKK